ncbi:MAG: hypothetical protein Q8K93_32645 [Reyranella sp.]|nr:hypothetical protein [Reyranella sp.]
MYFTGKLRLFAALIASAAIASGTLLSCLPQQQAPLRPHASLQPSDEDRCPLWKPDLPALDVVGIPKDVCDGGPPWEDFAHMAWQTFKTLVWPAAGRGKPDKGLPIDHPTGSRVFETYKADWETFLDKAAQPDEWHAYPEKAPVCANVDTMKPPLDKDSLVLASLHKFGNLDQVFEPGPTPLFHILVSQNRSLVRYLTGFGEHSFNTIRNNKLYEPQTLKNSDDPPVPPRYFEPGSIEKKFVGSINIKSAWIEMEGFSRDEKQSFYTRMAWVQDPPYDAAPRNCRLALVGLVALHIAHKTKSSPQWIWASFEHRRNVPDSEQGPDGGRYTFNDGRGTTPMADAPPPEAQLPYFRVNPFAIPDPFNVERKKAIPQVLRDINHSWQGKLTNTVWKNYELVAVQWPKYGRSPGRTGADEDKPGGKATAYPQPPCLGFDRNSSIANSVIETFLQANTDCKGNRETNPTCMSCHNLVRNYDFVWSVYVKDNDTAKAAISVLRQNLSVPQQ